MKNSIDTDSLRRMSCEESDRFSSSSRPDDVTHVRIVKNADARKRKIGRNEFCPCDSGFKYKRCHLYRR